MTDQSRIAPNYRGLADGKGERREPARAVSATQYELAKLAPGELWAHRAAQRDYGSGGNQGEFTGADLNEAEGALFGEDEEFTLAQAGSPDEVVDNRHLPKRIQEGITTAHAITDRNLDFPGEDGYPTPT